MVEIIGLCTMVALVWVLAWSMTGESESERRRMTRLRETDLSREVTARETPTRHAA